MNQRHLSVDLPHDVAVLLDRAAENTGCAPNRLVIDALRDFLAGSDGRVVAEADALEDEEQAFDEAREAVSRGDYVTLDELLDDMDDHRHPPC